MDSTDPGAALTRTSIDATDVLKSCHTELHGQAAMAGKRRMDLRVAFGLVCIQLFASAEAIMPATREQILCNSSEIVIATIIEGASADCRLKGLPNCDPQDVVRFSIRIDGVLGVRKHEHGYRIGDITEVTTRAVQITHPELSADHIPAGDLFVVPALGHALTDSEVSSLFLGKVYIFAVQSRPNPPFWSSTWDLQYQSWIEGIIHNADQYNCPEPNSVWLQ